MTKDDLIEKIGNLVDASLLRYRLSELSGTSTSEYLAFKALELPIETTLEEIKEGLITGELTFTEELIIEVEDMIVSLKSIRNSKFDFELECNKRKL